MCFKRVKEQPSWTMECQTDQSCADEIDGNVEHVLKPSDHLSSDETPRMQTCQFDVCGNFRCLCEICTAETERNAQKSKRYSILRLQTENEKFKTSIICRNCKTRSVEILSLPYAHIVCCEPCADILDNCPLCDDRILGTVKIYLS